ncbi:MAG TPA: hypothetical protein VKC66_04835 [Xanthobacteraceae bacterium]|nr:hypothetical protein [Xanthobacteraceae bacterium]
MPITDKDVADVCVGIYAYPDSPAVTGFRRPGRQRPDLLGVEVVGDCDVVVFRGSKTFEDWLRDFDVLANPFVHSKIGPVHPGFLLELDQVFREYQQYRQQGSGKLVISGHSLCARRASIFCGLAIVAGVVPVGRVNIRRTRSGISAACHPHLLDQGKRQLPERQLCDVRA